MAYSSWNIQLSNQWDVLGPFPQSAREQQFLSPSFPLNLSHHSVDFSRSWPSSYADGGSVSWSTARSNEHGDLQISFPDIRWQSLLDTEGWAALQHHAVIRSTFTIYPPQDGLSSAPPMHVLIHLSQGSYFTLRPAGRHWHHDFVPKWYAGNIYALPRVFPRHVILPVPPSAHFPTTYELWISADYEIRLFGRSANPTQSLTIDVQLPKYFEEVPVRHVKDRDIVPHFVEGRPFGDALGVALQNTHPNQWFHVVGVEMDDENVTGALHMPEPFTLAPTQTRVIPLILDQSALYNKSLDFNLLVQARDHEEIKLRVSLSIPLVHLALGPNSSWESIPLVKATYLYANSMPSIYYTIPPSVATRHSQSQPVLLALHGAGVDLLTSSFWSEALPRNPHSWIVLPTGRTSWGLDWHGPSLISSLQAVESLKSTLAFYSWDQIDERKLLVMGHSNGGQGTWYLAERWPDLVIGAIPAAGFIKSQLYVPLTHSRSSHYVDPSLEAILMSALTPDDNDLHLTNVAHLPILAIHGGNDDNVPTFHTREAVSILKTWNPQANVTMKEDAGQPHWYDAVLNNNDVQGFISETLAPKEAAWNDFTLTVSDPTNQGSSFGLRVLELEIPGRLGYLRMEKQSDTIGRLITQNIHSFSFIRTSLPLTISHVDGEQVNIGNANAVTLVRSESGVWEISSRDEEIHSRSTRIQSILSSPGPLRLVIDESDSSSMSAALRIATDLDIYHELDSEIISGNMPHPTSSRPRTGNVVCIGPSAYATSILRSNRTPFGLSPNGMLSLQEKKLDSPGLGILFLHPGEKTEDHQVLFIRATDDAGLERALRLFPIRTGVAVPEWIVAGEKMDEMGTAGIVGAGQVHPPLIFSAITPALSKALGFGIGPMGGQAACLGYIRIASLHQVLCAVLDLSGRIEDVGKK